MNTDVLKETVKQLLEDRSVLDNKIKELLNAILGLEKVRNDHPLIVELKKEHDESDMDNPEEKREVVIGKEIKRLAWYFTSPNITDLTTIRKGLVQIHTLVEELLKIHGVK